MSRFGDLELLIVDLFRTGAIVRGVHVPGIEGARTIDLAATSDLARLSAIAKPAIIVIAPVFEPGAVQTIGAHPTLPGTVRFVVRYMGESAKGPGFARHVAWGLCDQARALFLGSGWVPPPIVNEPGHPVRVEREFVLDTEGDLTTVQGDYALEQTIVF